MSQGCAILVHQIRAPNRGDEGVHDDGLERAIKIAKCAPADYHPFLEIFPSEMFTIKNIFHERKHRP